MNRLSVAGALRRGDSRVNPLRVGAGENVGATSFGVRQPGCRFCRVRQGESAKAGAKLPHSKNVGAPTLQVLLELALPITGVAR